VNRLMEEEVIRLLEPLIVLLHRQLLVAHLMVALQILGRRQRY
jgi:hypothetical protein